MYVYVISAGPEAQKIGIAKNTASRLAQLQTGQFQDLSLQFAAKVEDGRAVERLAHQIAADTRLKGEWFNIDVETASAVVREAVRRFTDSPDRAWALAGGWHHDVGDKVVCRIAGTLGFPEPQPVINQTYTISQVYPDGTLDVEELENDAVAFCPSMFWPKDRSAHD